MRNRFDEQLHTLNHEMLEMGALIESAIRNATTALVNQDVEAALQAIAADKEVDQAERDIESLCLKLLLQQQPVARDLRLISSALKMITDMERSGDLLGRQRNGCRQRSADHLPGGRCAGNRQGCAEGRIRRCSAAP